MFFSKNIFLKNHLPNPSQWSSINDRKCFLNSINHPFFLQKYFWECNFSFLEKIWTIVSIQKHLWLVLHLWKDPFDPKFKNFKFEYKPAASHGWQSHDGSVWWVLQKGSTHATESLTTLASLYSSTWTPIM